jgi:rhodanese-related sulfurtransferase
MSTIHTAQELKTRLDSQNPEVVLIDVRTEAEFRQGHIAGAINLDVTNILRFMSEIKKLDKSKDYIVYCRSGGRSSMAGMIMAQNKLKVTNVKVGFPALVAAGLEVNTLS